MGYHNYNLEKGDSQDPCYTLRIARACCMTTYYRTQYSNGNGLGIPRRYLDDIRPACLPGVCGLTESLSASAFLQYRPAFHPSALILPCKNSPGIRYCSMLPTERSAASATLPYLVDIRLGESTWETAIWGRLAMGRRTRHVRGGLLKVHYF